LGTGIGRLGITFQDIEIDADDMGMPLVVLHGRQKRDFPRWAACPLRSVFLMKTNTPWHLCVVEVDASKSRKTAMDEGVPFDE